jgi:hypothetical protein
MMTNRTPMQAVEVFLITMEDESIYHRYARMGINECSGYSYICWTTSPTCKQSVVSSDSKQKINVYENARRIYGSYVEFKGQIIQLTVEC